MCSAVEAARPDLTLARLRCSGEAASPTKRTLDPLLASASCTDAAPASADASRRPCTDQPPAGGGGDSAGSDGAAFTAAGRRGAVRGAARPGRGESGESSRPAVRQPE